MRCQIGVYANSHASFEQGEVLVYLSTDQSARQVLEAVVPFLRRFQVTQGMEQTETLAAWLTWHLINMGMVSADEPGFSGIGLGRRVRSDIEFFFRVTPGRIEVSRIDDLLDWHPLAAVDIPQETLELGTH
jgi:hypothetical protein